MGVDEASFNVCVISCQFHVAMHVINFMYIVNSKFEMGMFFKDVHISLFYPRLNILWSHF